MAKDHPFTIVAFGDSITQAVEVPEADRWPALVGGRLAERFAQLKPVVVNAGVGGNTSREGLARMERDVLAHSPEIVLVEFGGNDSTYEPARSVSLDEFKANLAAMKARLDACNGAEMIVLPFPPVVDRDVFTRDHEKYKPAGGPDRYIEAYRAAARDFSRTHKLALADIDPPLRADMAANFLPDGVHMTAAGNRAIAQTVLPVLEARVAAYLNS
ncbi:MAG: hypothetical protein K8S99_18325 [Planctomycetes bacterium]|nr:hypothetical protein [Planctomycetota bacterium]